MITEKDVRPIPKYILNAIMRKDKKFYPTPAGINRFYAYLAVWKKELVKVTVAVKHYKRKWYCKQVVVHGLRSTRCLVKDLEYNYIGMGFRVDWYKEGIQHYKKWFKTSYWCTANDNTYDPYATIINPNFIYKFPEYKYCAYDLYKGVDILPYLRLYEQYPQVEYLVKLGFSDYVHSKQILRECSKNKAFCKELDCGVCHSHCLPGSRQNPAMAFQYQPEPARRKRDGDHLLGQSERLLPPGSLPEIHFAGSQNSVFPVFCG